MNFQPAKAKLKLGSLDEPGLNVEAQYNPKELQIDMNVPWKKPDAATKTGNQEGGAGSSPLELEFTGAEGRSLTIEMLFDGYEGEKSGRYVKVKDMVETLTKLATVRKATSNDEQMRRPHHCVISWGDGGLPKFQCVIESLSTKYSMFSTDGEPLRATCTVKLKEASVKK
jgi:hypothetical protein